MAIKKNLQENIHFIYKLSVVLIILLVLVNMPPLFSPPAFGKAIPFRIIFALTLFYFTYDFLFKKNSLVYKRVFEKIKAKKDFSFYTPLILLLVLFITLFFSVDINFSIFGSPPRGGGFLNFGLLIIFGYFLFYLLNKNEWKTVWKTLFFTGVVGTFFAIIQWKEILESVFVGQATRPYASFGNPTILGVYLSFLIFPIILFFIKEKGKLKKFVYFFALSVVTFGMLLTYTRAAIVGVLLGALYFVFFFPSKKRVFRTIKLGFLFLTTLFLFFFSYINLYEHPSFIKNSDFLQGLANRMHVGTAFEDPRIGGFVIAWKSILEKPLTGYGVENFAYAFDRHYNPHAPFIYKDIPWWDKAHNLPLEIGTWGGFPALIALLLIFITLFLSLRKNKSLESHAVKSTLITFFASNFFTVDDFTIYLFFTVLIGYTLFLTVKNNEIDIKNALKKREKIFRYRYYFLIISIPLLFFFISKYNYQLLISNRDITLAEAHQRAGNCDIALAFMERATEKDSPISSYIFSKKGLVIENCIEEKEEKTFLLTKETVQKRPSYTRSWINLGITSIGYLPYAENKEETLKVAENAFIEALEISPLRYPIKSDLAHVFLCQGSWEEASQTADDCLSIFPHQNCYYTKGVALFALNKEYNNYFDKIDKEFDISIALNETINIQNHLKNYKAMIPLYLLLIEENPQNSQNYFSIAEIYKEVGDYENARKYAIMAVELHPALINIVKPFLDSLSN
jgi:tetratricopeptide (TPR) repeat protein